MDELLKLLKHNALETPKNLARMLNTTEEAVKAKIAGYEGAGIIRGYQAVLNTDLMDVELVRAVIEIKVTPEREGGFNRIAERVSKFPEVESVYLMSGTYDLMAVVAGRNLKDVAFFVSEKLATIQGIISTGTHFMLKTYKNNGVLMEAEKTNERLKVSP
ncbi:MAG: Lrp/AsnC family transcriptional regulator [bacterium]